jgi:hypothetical protein
MPNMNMQMPGMQMPMPNMDMMPNMNMQMPGMQMPMPNMDMNEMTMQQPMGNPFMMQPFMHPAMLYNMMGLNPSWFNCMSGSGGTPFGMPSNMPNMNMMPNMMPPNMNMMPNINMEEQDEEEM